MTWQKIIILPFFLLFPLVFVSAFQLPGLDITGGLLWTGNAETEGAPSPLRPVLGIGLPLEFARFFSLEPELSVYGTQYQLIPGEQKAVPTEVEYKDSVWMLTLLLDIPSTFRIHFSEKIAAGFSINTAFIFRIPTIGWGEGAGSADDPSYRTSISTYFYSQGRFFYPGAGLVFNWSVFKELGFFVRLTTYFPLFHAWDGDTAAFWDQMIISGKVGFRIAFK